MLDLEVRLTSDVRTYSSLLQMLELTVALLQMFELKVRYFKLWLADYAYLENRGCNYSVITV